VSAFPYFYDWNNAATLTGDGHYAVSGFAIDSSTSDRYLRAVIINNTWTDISLSIYVDATGKSLTGQEVLSFEMWGAPQSAFLGATINGMEVIPGNGIIKFNGLSSTHQLVQITIPHNGTYFNFSNTKFSIDIYGDPYGLFCMDNFSIAGGALPIQLATFNANVLPSHSGVQLNWTTVSEVNNYGFFVQRGSSKANIANISSLIPGHGTSALTHSYSWTDASLAGGYYRVNQIDLDGTSHYSDIVEVSTPTAGKLDQNFPNPFNPSTQIAYSTSRDGITKLEIYNILAQKVLTAVNEFQSAGSYRATIDGSGLSSGTYIYVLTNGDFRAVKRMTMLK
jgi:hypothetical protein